MLTLYYLHKKYRHALSAISHHNRIALKKALFLYDNGIWLPTDILARKKALFSKKAKSEVGRQFRLR